MKYYGYCRVSTETQAEKGFGLITQREEIEKYAKAHGIELAGIYSDEGISANIHMDDDDDAIEKRAGFCTMYGLMEKPESKPVGKQRGNGDAIIVLNTNRLWRSQKATVVVQSMLLRKDIKVISIQQPDYNLYSSNPYDEFTSQLLTLVDALDRALTAAKLAAGRTTKASKGDKPAGVCPFGYGYADDRKSVIINEAEAATVRLIFSEGQKGKSLRQIADILNDKGITTRRGKEWAAGNVQVIMKNRFYIGELQHQGKAIKGNHEPIISKIQFGKVQSQLEQRHK